jgi:8-oxo-dGTP pyrophosphatase MutT (NUDIX family)
MAHIHTEPGQHDHTVSGFIIRLDKDEPRILLHMHKKLGVYLQFGGHIELDENPWQALEHEVKEESGYGLGQLTLLQPHDRIKNLPDSEVVHPMPVSYNTHRFSDDHFHIDIAYAFTTTEPPRHQLDKSESDEIIALTRSELANLPADEKIFENVQIIGLFIFDTCLSRWEPVSTAEF